MKYLIWIVLAAGVAAGGYWWWQKQHPAAPTETAAAPPAASGEATIEHPIEQAQVEPQPDAATTALPALADSDTAAQAALQQVFGANASALFILNDIIRRIVATVDNLPRERVAQRLLPVKPAPGKFKVDTDGSLAADNASRYAAYVQAADAVNTKVLVAAYVHLYPLFQQAYQDLGYPKGYFNDRLIAAIDNLLATPEVSQPLRLEQHSVLYQFADPDLESRSAGQKILLRIGTDNAAIIKRKLREIRAALTAGAVAKAGAH